MKQVQYKTYALKQGSFLSSLHARVLTRDAMLCSSHRKGAAYPCLCHSASILHVGSDGCSAW